MPDDVIENPVTGERARFLPTRGADRVAFEVEMRPGGFAPFTHVHPHQQERFVVLDGRPRFRIDDKEFDAAPGDELVLLPGTRHVLHNPTDDIVRVMTEVTPPMRTEEMFHTFFRLSRTRKFSRRGVPYNPLVSALFAWEFRNEGRVTDFPFRFLFPLSAVGALAARLVGVRL